METSLWDTTVFWMSMPGWRRLRWHEHAHTYTHTRTQVMCSHSDDLRHGNGLLVRMCKKKKGWRAEDVNGRSVCCLKKAERNRYSEPLCHLSAMNWSQYISCSCTMVKLLLFFKPVICHSLSYLFLRSVIFQCVWAFCQLLELDCKKEARMLFSGVSTQTCKRAHTHTHTHTVPGSFCLIKTRSGMRDHEKGFTHTWIQTSTHVVCGHTQTHTDTHSCSCCQSDSFASADSHQEFPAAAFPLFPSTHMRLISHSTLYLSHLSAFVLVSFIIAAVNTSAIGEAQCEVPALKEFHSDVRCAYLNNLTYCHIEWRIKWKWHRPLISCLLLAAW